MSEADLSQLSMHELFRMEAESQTQVLTADLLVLERNPTAPEVLESCMRAAHSLKGAARIIGLNPAVSVTHAMEDCFVAAQHGRILLDQSYVDLLLVGVDLITTLANATDAQSVEGSERDPAEVGAFLTRLSLVLATDHAPPLAGPAAVGSEISRPQHGPPSGEPAPPMAVGENAVGAPVPSVGVSVSSERAVRVTAQSFDRLLGLSAQSLVESRWLEPFASSLLAIKSEQEKTAKALESLRDSLITVPDERAQAALAAARSGLLACQMLLGERMEELDLYDRRVSGVAQRMYQEALSCRMRPFADGVQTFPRMLRDLAHGLGKEARLEIIGASTAVDRDVLEKLEAPLTHLLRNALDHGIDFADVRRGLGKSGEGVVRLEACHVAGMLQISVSDDGEGIDLESVRRVIVERALLDRRTADELSAAELHEFLFLPGFTIRGEVTEISGRGVGLDAVQSAVKQLRGSLRVSSRAGAGALFELQLPLAVSFVRSLITQIAGEAYAFPLAHIEKTLTIARSEVHTLEGRQQFQCSGRQIGLVMAHQILDGGQVQPSKERLDVIVVRDKEHSYGLVVDRFVGVRELVVHALDPRLGKIKDISAGALLEDGAPVLIVDVEDLVRSIERLVMLGDLRKVGDPDASTGKTRRKRVLVVDDSFTVRELERKLISGGGYDVEVAVDGIDGWNAVRVGAFDLVVTDVDMPRMDGIELVRLIKTDIELRTLPVVIVSYKDREEDKQRGLQAGADFYLTKDSFRNEGLLEAVIDLIGEA